MVHALTQWWACTTHATYPTEATRHKSERTQKVEFFRKSLSLDVLSYWVVGCQSGVREWQRRGMAVCCLWRVTECGPCLRINNRQCWGWGKGSICRERSLCRHRGVSSGRDGVQCVRVWCVRASKCMRCLHIVYMVNVSRRGLCVLPSAHWQTVQSWQLRQSVWRHWCGFRSAQIHPDCLFRCSADPGVQTWLMRAHTVLVSMDWLTAWSIGCPWQLIGIIGSARHACQRVQTWTGSDMFQVIMDGTWRRRVGRERMVRRSVWWLLLKIHRRPAGWITQLHSLCVSVLTRRGGVQFMCFGTIAQVVVGLTRRIQRKSSHTHRITVSRSCLIRSGRGKLRLSPAGGFRQARCSQHFTVSGCFSEHRRMYTWSNRLPVLVSAQTWCCHADGRWSRKAVVASSSSCSIRCSRRKLASCASPWLFTYRRHLSCE